MANWTIDRIDYVPEVGPANPSLTVRMRDKDTGSLKVEQGLVPPGVIGQTVDGFLCVLQEEKGYTPNDFNVSCA